jgi:hypothetical protein
MTDNVRVIATVVVVLVILCPLGYSLVYPVVLGGAEGSESFPQTPPGRGSCVADRTYMRFRHMDLLKRVRDEAVREGIRGVKGLNDQEITLNNCLECHGSSQQACAQCHQQVNLHLNCFRCHWDPDAVAEDGG